MKISDRYKAEIFYDEPRDGIPREVTSVPLLEAGFVGVLTIILEVFSE